jgi:predicted transcriptional regulator
MSSVRINDSPNHFMVLDAIERGAKTIDKIAKVTRIDKAHVELVVNDLITQRLVIRTEKKGFLGRTKVELTISHTGLQVLNIKKQELEKQWQQVQQWYNNGQTQQVQGYMDNNRMWIPMMLFSGVMNAMFFMSMMSMLGMALNPIESGIIGDEGTGAAVADSGEATAAEDGGAGADSDGTDFGGDFGGGDFSF